MSAKKRAWNFAGDDSDSISAKRRLVECMNNLSLDNHPPTPTPKPQTPDTRIENNAAPMMMDTGDENIIFIPSIDQYLEDDDKLGGNVFDALFKIPDVVLKNQNTLYNQPSKALILYEPKERVIWRHLYKKLFTESLLSSQMDLDDEVAFHDVTATMNVNYNDSMGMELDNGNDTLVDGNDEGNDTIDTNDGTETMDIDDEEL